MFFLLKLYDLEYACVGYTDKRIQLRRNRFLAMRKVVEEKRLEAFQKVIRSIN